MNRIVVCGVQTLYIRGGAELLVDSLAAALRARDHQVDVVNLPFVDVPRTQILQTFLAWRALQLRFIHGRSVDMVIPTKFPSYAVNHPNKQVWLVHQHRQAYELFGTRFSDMHIRPDGRLFAWLVRRLDAWGLKDAAGLHSISQHTADRLWKYNHLRAKPVYPPSRLAPLLHPGEYGSYVLAPGRFETIKRFDLVLRAMALVKCPVTCLIAGDGAERDNLLKLASELGINHRVKFLGRVSDEELVELYANCLGVVFPPFEEDYGFVTAEAFQACKPVITATDSGGPCEFVETGVNGYVAEPTPAAMADALDQLWSARGRVCDMGANGYERVKGISWDAVAAALTGEA